MRCKGCFKRFKNRPGLWKHLSQAHYVPCRQIYLNHLGYLPGHNDGDGFSVGPTVPDSSDVSNSRKNFISGMIRATDVKNALDVLLVDDLSGDDSDMDISRQTPESEESEWEDEFEDENDPEPEPETAPQTASENEEPTLGFDNSPLLNPAQQAEVEQSQEHGHQVEVENFGGRAGQHQQNCPRAVALWVNFQTQTASADLLCGCVAVDTLWGTGTLACCKGMSLCWGAVGDKVFKAMLPA